MADQVVRGGVALAEVPAQNPSGDGAAIEGPRWSLRIYVAVLAAAWVGVVGIGWLREPPTRANAFTWIALTLLFAGAEYAAVLFHDSRFRFGLSASEAVLMPMLVGLNFFQVVVGASLGIGLARIAGGTRSPTKEIFNISQFGLAAAGAHVVWTSLADPDASFSVIDMSAAAFGIIVFVSLTHLLFAGAMASGGRDRLSTAIRDIGYAEVVSVGASLIIGFFFTTAFLAAEWTVAFFPVALAAVSLGYRAWVRQAADRERLAQLHAASHALSATADLGPAMDRFLRSVAQAVSASSARVVLEIDGRRVCSALQEGVLILDQAAPNAVSERIFDRVRAADSSLSLQERDVDRERGGDATIVAVPIRVHDRMAGCLIVQDRRGADDFGPEDITLVEALGKELALAAEGHSLFHDVAREREHFELLVDAVKDYAIYMVDRDGQITRWNSGAERIFGFTQENAIGTHVSMLYPKDGRDAWAEETAVADTDRWVGERWRKRADGSRFLAHVTTTPVLASQGDLRGYATVVRDVTDLVAAEREREDLVTQLHQAQKLESVGRLAGGIAHDFNNLLGAILNYTGFVINSLSNGSGDVIDDLRQIEGAAERAVGMTRQLLIFSRREVPRPTILNLNEVIRDFAPLLQRSVGKHVLLKLELAPSLPFVRADAGQLEHVLMNLLVNASDAVAGEGTVTIRTAEATDAAGSTRQVVLSVEDTGCGMPADVRQKVFEPFFTTKPKEIGTGLGLSTVHGIVSQAGGSIDVATSEGLGTTMKIYLPAVAEETIVTLDNHQDPQDDPAPSDRLILVVDDQDFVRNMTTRILESSGYSVVHASSGEEALQAIERAERPIDLILSDVVMPVMSGLELGRRVADRYPTMKILYMSAYSTEILTDAEAHGEGAPLLQKPFQPDELLACVGEALR